MALELLLVELGIIEVSQIRGKAPERSSIGALRDEKVNGKSVCQPSSKRESFFHFNLDIAQRFPAGQEITDSIDAIVRGEGKVTGLRRHRKGKPQPLTTMYQMMLPRIDVMPEAGVHASLKTVQSTLVDQFQTECT